VLSTIWSAIGLPAALLLGPMVAGILFGVNGVRLNVPRAPFVAAQGVVGALVSASITPTIAATFADHWLLFCAVVGATLLGSAVLGWLISRFGLISGATAVYGSSAGAAAAMVLQAEASGADARIVAFMQYLRVLMVVLAAALVARYWAGAADVHPPGIQWTAPVNWPNLATVVLIAALAQQAARLLRVPAWGLLGPMMALSAAHAAGLVAIDLPGWLLAAAYAVLGWYIGLSFRRDVLLHAWRVLPVVAGSALCLMALCCVLAWCLTRLANVDALTAYLATSPGGLDSVAIIAASTPRVDLPFVLALQSVRLVFAIGLGPLIARLVVRYSPHLR
jgi:membrane AbrB-like protein